MTTSSQKRLVLGAHISGAGHLSYALDRAESIGCTTMQIFSKSNRQWYAKQIEQADAQQFIERSKNSPVRPVAVHASYIINIGAENPEIEQKSIAALKEEVARCEQLTIPYLVLHPGSAGSQTETQCLERIAKNLSNVLEISGSTIICLENMAGQGTIVGHTFEQLKFIRDSVPQKNRIGFCFDTCHAFAAGYDLRTSETYQATMQRFDAILRLDNLKIMHLNDSKKGLGSRVDRHENIGKGLLGLEAFRCIMNDPRLFDVAKILEIPDDNLPGYAANMAVLKELLTDETKKFLHI
ncbi:MAG: deoxyribonuclease IV [Candidatus Babeliales bacterium]